MEPFYLYDQSHKNHMDANNSKDIFYISKVSHNYASSWGKRFSVSLLDMDETCCDNCICVNHIAAKFGIHKMAILFIDIYIILLIHLYVQFDNIKTLELHMINILLPFNFHMTNLGKF